MASLVEDEGGGGASIAPAPRRRRQGDRFGRGDRSPVAVWFWEIDRVLLCLVTVLIGIGLIAVAAAAPAAAHRYSDAGHAFPRLYYFWRQLIWTILSVPVLIGVSMLPKDMARRLALFGAVAFTLLLMMVPVLGGEAKNGAQRWVNLGPLQVQPAEFLKPFFVIAVAWLLSLRATDGKAHREGDSKLPTPLLSGLYLGLVAIFLMKQPDFGQTVIFAFVWAVLLMISGVQMKWLAALGGAAVAGIGLAYEFYPVAHERIGRFLNSDDPSNREIGGQVESALRTLTHGGFLGTGPGGGTMKMNLPEPHTDYIFSVIGEEFGLVACLGIAIIYLTIVVRVLLKLLHEEDRFLMLASAGLVTQFGLQAMINMAVNVHLAPSKGMTLPFISYGGSSMIALSMGFGLLLAFTRKNPYLTRSPYVVSWKAK